MVLAINSYSVEWCFHELSYPSGVDPNLTWLSYPIKFTEIPNYFIDTFDAIKTCCKGIDNTCKILNSSNYWQNRLFFYLLSSINKLEICHVTGNSLIRRIRCGWVESGRFLGVGHLRFNQILNMSSLRSATEKTRYRYFQQCWLMPN